MEDPKKILIVENETVIALDIKRTVIQLGYSVISAVSRGEEALSIINENKPDVVVMDILLDGDLNGIETGVIISEKYKIPIIYIIKI